MKLQDIMVREVVQISPDEPTFTSSRCCKPASITAWKLSSAVPLERIRQRAASELKRLPEPLRALDAAPAYPVTISKTLLEMAATIERMAT